MGTMTLTLSARSVRLNRATAWWFLICCGVALVPGVPGRAQTPIRPHGIAAPLTSSLNLFPGLPATAYTVAVRAGLSHSLALRSDGTVFAWGQNSTGELGNGAIDQ